MRPALHLPHAGTKGRACRCDSLRDAGERPAAPLVLATKCTRNERRGCGASGAPQPAIHPRRFADRGPRSASRASLCAVWSVRQRATAIRLPSRRRGEGRGGMQGGRRGWQNGGPTPSTTTRVSPKPERKERAVRASSRKCEPANSGRGEGRQSEPRVYGATGFEWCEWRASVLPPTSHTSHQQERHHESPTDFALYRTRHRRHC